MDINIILPILMADLQLLSADDNLRIYLISLIDTAQELIATEGIVLDSTSAAAVQVVAQYAAYLYRHRADENTAMPRFLRWELNNMLFSQKGRTGGHNA